MIRVGLCAIVKDEESYLAEWVGWHARMGVSKFFLYDNSEAGDLDLCFEEDLDAEFTLCHRPGIAAQMSAYRLCCVEHAGDADWIAFLDADEFLWHPEGLALPEILARYPDASALWAPWRMFGWKPHLTRPAGGVVESYLWRAADDDPVNKPGKSIVRPAQVQNWIDPHLPTMPVTARLETGSGLLVNHYFTKSREEARRKCARPRADCGTVRDWQKEFVDRAPRLEAVYDDRLARLWRE